VFEDVEADPPSHVIERAVGLCRDKGIGLVASIGGGSARDSAKRVAYLAKTPDRLDGRFVLHGKANSWRDARDGSKTWDIFEQEVTRWNNSRVSTTKCSDLSARGVLANGKALSLNPSILSISNCQEEGDAGRQTALSLFAAEPKHELIAQSMSAFSFTLECPVDLSEGQRAMLGKQLGTTELEQSVEPAMSPCPFGA
jgi:Iron-containing alcohol dehydrogenase